MPALRPGPRLLLLAALAAAGWFGGRWAHEGLLPAPRRQAGASSFSSSAAPSSTAVRAPAARASDSHGEWMARALARAASPDEFPALLEEVDSQFPGEHNAALRTAARRWLLSLWLSASPDAAVPADFVRGKSDLLLEDFGYVLGALAPQTAVAMLTDTSVGLVDEDPFCNALLRSLAEHHPRELLRLGPAEARGYYHTAARNLAAIDPAAAAAAVGALLDLPEDDDDLLERVYPGLFAVANQWAAADPAACRRWVDTLPAPLVRGMGLRAWLDALAKKDPHAALRELSGITPADLGEIDGPLKEFLGYPPDTRTLVLAELAKKSVPDALAAMHRMLREDSAPQPTEDESGATEDIVIDRRLQKFTDAMARAVAPDLPDEPAALLTAIQTIAPGGLNEVTRRLLEVKSQTWTATTCLEAARLLAAPPWQTRLDTNSPILLQALDDDLTIAPSMLALLVPEDQGAVAYDLVEQMEPGLSPELITKITASLPADAWNQTLAPMAGENCPAESAAAIAALPDTDEMKGIRASFAAAWAEHDPEAAARWVATLPSENAAAQAAAGLASAWAAYDSTAVFHWAGQFPKGPLRDHAFAGMAVGAATADPASGWTWATSVEDPRTALEAYQGIATRWGNEAPPDFRTDLNAILDRAKASGAERGEILQLLEHPPGEAEEMEDMEEDE